MSDSDHGDQTTKQHVGPPTMTQPGHDHQDPASESDIGNSRTMFIANPVDTPDFVDVENQNKVTKSEVSDKIVRRWRRSEDLLKKGSLATSGMAFLFSLLAFIVMASDNHGDWKQFDKWPEYRYVLAVAILSTLYAGAQIFRQVHELRTRKHLLHQRTSAFLNFFGDQIMAYLLISAASAAIPHRLIACSNI